jgi:hypothetical protein
MLEKIVPVSNKIRSVTAGNTCFLIVMMIYPVDLLLLIPVFSYSIVADSNDNGSLVAGAIHRFERA